MKNKKEGFDKPTLQEIKDLFGQNITDEIAGILLEQIEEFCLIIIEQYASG